MKIIDTHTHIFVKDYNDDIEEVIARAIKQGVNKMLMPNIDSSTIKDLLALHYSFPNHCLPMMGLHPTSVKEDFEKELSIIEQQLNSQKYIGIGEIGIDLYWDKIFKEEQHEAFRYQLRLAKKYKLPVSIHTRNSFDVTLNIVKHELTNDLKGVFHCFTGSLAEANKIIDTGFFIGIGGIITFKNSGLSEVVKNIPSKHLVIETDSPWLTPVPHRGKRNESSYLINIIEKLAIIKGVSIEEVAEITTDNATKIFNL